MSVGFVLLVHTALDRAAQVARHLNQSGSPVVIHIDQSVPDDEAERFQSILRLHENIHFSPRFRCEWGTWAIVNATQAAAQILLEKHTEIGHIFLSSGSCMPLRPMRELVQYLDIHKHVDFIESVTTSDVRWTLGGLEEERFSLYFPFAWKRRRKLFDRFVTLQRRLGIRRKPPADVVPHLGSQWWCLTRKTMHKILSDHRRAEFEQFFKHSWIPDESYFQTLVRLHSDNISRSLTLSKFDYQGRPYVFYDDHLELLRRSDCFFARKIWPKADRLYRNFLERGTGQLRQADPDPGKIDRLFSQAVRLRTHGRPGLVMQSRFPADQAENRRTAAPYSVMQGFDEVFEGFEDWLSDAAATTVHGRLFHPNRVKFSGGADVFTGGLTSNPYLRDYDCAAFLRNLTWNSRGQRQFFQYAPNDGLAAWELIVQDPNAQVSVVTGAWIIGIMHQDVPFEEARRLAAQCQQREIEQLAILNGPQTKAKTRVITLSDYLSNPMQPLQDILDESVAPVHSYLGEAPRMVFMGGLEEFIQRLRNAGMHLHLTGHFSAPSHQDSALETEPAQAGFP